MRQCLCSDSPRFTTSRFSPRPPSPISHPSSPPSGTPTRSFSYHLFVLFSMRPSPSVALFGWIVVSPQKHLLCTEMRVLLEPIPEPFSSAFLISVPSLPQSLPAIFALAIPSAYTCPSCCFAFGPFSAHRFPFYPAPLGCATHCDRVDRFMRKKASF